MLGFGLKLRFEPNPVLVSLGFVQKAKFTGLVEVGSLVVHLHRFEIFREVSNAKEMQNFCQLTLKEG